MHDQPPLPPRRPPDRLFLVPATVHEFDCLAHLQLVSPPLFFLQAFLFRPAHSFSGFSSIQVRDRDCQKHAAALHLLPWAILVQSTSLVTPQSPSQFMTMNPDLSWVREHFPFLILYWY